VTLDDPFRVVMFGVDVIRWRRPPVADLPPVTVAQAFSLQRLVSGEPMFVGLIGFSLKG